MLRDWGFHIISAIFESSLGSENQQLLCGTMLRQSAHIQIYGRETDSSQCDEGKPSCQKCITHKLECQFSNQIRILYQSQISPSPTVTSSTDQEIENTTSTPLSTSISNDYRTDLKLMHHFTTSTYQTFFDTDPDVTRIWQIVVPEWAFKHQFLLHIVLAISALHLSHTNVDDSAYYVAYANKQYETSLRLSSSALAEISPSNCHALHIFSAIVFIFQLGISYGSGCLLYSADGVLAHWVIHLRGITTIMAPCFKDLKSGALKPLIDRDFGSVSLHGIDGLLNQLADHIRSIFPKEEEVVRIYLDAIAQLIHWSRFDDGGFFGWMCRADKEFMALLAIKDQFSLIIFSYSCVLMKDGQPRYWIAQWPQGLLREIYGYLDEPHRALISWPLQMLDLSEDSLLA